MAVSVPNAPYTTLNESLIPAAKYLDLGGLSLGTHQNLRELLTSREPMTLLWRSASERAEALIFQLAQRGIPQQMIRWTGWCANIAEHSQQIPIIVEAFKGIKGFHFSGGTEMRDINSGQIKTTVCDIPAKIKGFDHDNVLIGIIPKVSENPTYLRELGIVLRVNPKAGTFTTINEHQNIGIVLQPDVNGKYEWIDEARECRRINANLLSKGWNNTLAVFGGSLESDPDKLSRVEQELLWWTEDKLKMPGWNINIILFKGSGGVADKYASDSEWLKDKPFIKVVDLNTSSIRSTLKNIGLQGTWN